jgi:DNA-binding CsgD family transcriptional regulator
MGGSDFLGRWIDLTADLLARPIESDPLITICDELAARYSAPASGTIDYSDVRVRVGLYHVDLDTEPYIPHVGDHPLTLHFRETKDSHVASLADASRFAGNERSQAVLQSLREENLRDFVFMPLRPCRTMEHRWLGLSSDDLGPSVRDDLERLRPLVAALDAQRAVVADSFARSAMGSTSLAVAGLSVRELAVLALIAQGLTAVAIGQRLRISPRTVSKHQQNIYRKLEVRDRLSAVIRVQELGLALREALLPRREEVRFVEADVVLHPLLPTAGSGPQLRNAEFA